MTDHILLKFNGDDPHIVPLEYMTTLECHITNAGIPDEWLPKVKTLWPGFYVVDYETEWESDGDWETGYQEYPVLGELKSIRPSFFAFVLWLWNFPIFKVRMFIADLFKRTWYISYCYGGLGHYSGPYYLPVVFFIFIQNNKNNRWYGGTCERRIVRRA